MDKGNLKIDPRGVIYESYRIDGIEAAECRSIFLDWALGLAEGADFQAALAELRDAYVADHPGHPMNDVIAEGLARQAVPGRRRGRRRQ